MTVEVGTAHSGFGCIGCAQESRFFRDDFSQVRGPGGQVGSEGPECFYVMAQGLGDADGSVGCAREG